MEKKPLSIFSFSAYFFKVFAISALVGITFSYLFEELIIYSLEVHGAAKINRIYSSAEPNEIPIFGSSRAEGNYVPSKIDGNCYNYGISGTQANIWFYLLGEELKKDRKTPIILNLDLNGFKFSDGDISNYLPTWSNSKHILQTPGKWNYSIPFIKYFGHYETYTQYYISELTNLTQLTEKGGTFKKNSLTKVKFDALVQKRLKAESSFSIEKVLLEECYHLIESTDRKIITVVSPYHKSYFNKFENIEVANDFLLKLGKRDNVEVIDLRHYIEDDELFTNTTHLNYKGAVSFSEELNRLLVELNILATNTL